MDVDREAAVDLGGLRQVTNVPPRETGALDRPGERLDQSSNPLEERRFAGPIGTHHGDQHAGLDLTAETMNGRMAVIAEREITEMQDSSGHRHFHDIAQKTAAHTTAIASAAQASRAGIPISRNEGATRAAGWLSLGLCGMDRRCHCKSLKQQADRTVSDCYIITKRRPRPEFGPAFAGFSFAHSIADTARLCSTQSSAGSGSDWP